MKFAWVRLREEAREGVVTDLSGTCQRSKLPEEFYVAVEKDTFFGLYCWVVGRDCKNVKVRDEQSGEDLALSAYLTEDMILEARFQDAVAGFALTPEGGLERTFWLVDKRRKLWRKGSATTRDYLS